MPTCAPSNKQHGFTLLEIVIAIGIFAAMYVLAQYAFNQALDHRDMLSDHAQVQEKRQRALLFLAQDIEQLIARPVRDSFGDLQPALHGDTEYITFTKLGWSNVMDLRQRSQMQRVSYELGDDDNELIRKHWPYLDQMVDSEPEEAVLLDDVEDIRWRYLIKGANDKWEWQELWPLPNMDGLHPMKIPMPKSIELRIRFTDDTEVLRYYRTVINPLEAGE